MGIQRFDLGPRMCQAVKHGDTVYLAGQVALDAGGESVTKQTENVLQRIDHYLAEAGTDKSKILSATIWLANISTFNEMNAVWESWIDLSNPPVRACVEATLAAPKFTVEIMVVAAA